MFVEHKGLSLSVHYRLAQVSKEQIKEAVQRVVDSMPVGGKTLLTEGKKVIEIRPAADWDKGRAVKLLMKRYGKGGRRSGLLPIYLGDDQTDEDAFRAIAAYGRGISVRVGEPDGASAARYFVRSTGEASAFLEMVAHLFDRPHGEAAWHADGAMVGNVRRHAGNLPV